MLGLSRPEPFADDGDHALQRARVGRPGQAADDQGLHVRGVHVSADRSGPLGAYQQLSQFAHHVVLAGGSRRVDVEAGARERLGDGAIGALPHDRGEELKERLARVLVAGQGACLVAEPLDATAEDGLEQRLLGGEVPADRAGAGTLLALSGSARTAMASILSGSATCGSRRISNGHRALQSLEVVAVARVEGQAPAEAIAAIIRSSLRGRG